MQQDPTLRGAIETLLKINLMRQVLRKRPGWKLMTMVSSHPYRSPRLQWISGDEVIRTSTSLQSYSEARIFLHRFAASSPLLARQLDRHQTLTSINSCMRGRGKWKASLR